MSTPISQARQPNQTVAAAIDRVRADGAETSLHAVVVGDRSGLVAWANPAWTEITGFSTAETVPKPIGHFLDRSGIELELVDFVGQYFLEGRSCIIEFPFEAFASGRTIQIRLEVEPVRDALGDLEAFIAVAQIIEANQSGELVPEGSGCEATKPLSAAYEREMFNSTNTSPIALSAFVRDIFTSTASRSRRATASVNPIDRIHFDFALDFSLPAIEISSPRLRELAECLCSSASIGAQEPWGCVTVMTGRTEVNRSHVSQAHPIAARPSALALGESIFLEVHDTGPAMDHNALARIDRRQPGQCARENILTRALEICEENQISLHLDSTPGCGTQALVLFPIPSEFNR